MKQITPGLAVLLLLVFPLALIAQKAPVKWGKISDEELEMTIYPLDSTAGALVLADYGDLSFDFDDRFTRTKLTRLRRVKILNRSGFDQGEINIPFYKNTQKVGNLRAQVFSPDGSKEKLKNNDFFEQDNNEYWASIQFALPNLQEGSVIEYEYEILDEDITSLPEWYFQSEIPTKLSELHLHVPNFYEYVYLKQGPEPDIQETKTFEATLSFEGQLGRTEMSHTRILYNDLPAMKEESFITTMDDYLARIRLQLKATKFSNQYKPVFSDWSTTAKELMDSDQFGGQLNNKNLQKAAWETLGPQLSEVEAPYEKAKIIYDYVNSHMKWNGLSGIGASDKLDKCLEKGEGTAAEINLSLLALFQHAGLKAYPLLVSSRDHGLPVTTYPILDQFNHTAVFLQLLEKGLVVDAGNPYRPMDLPGLRCTNYAGWVVNPEAPQWIELAPQAGEKTEFIQTVLHADGSMDGTYTAKFEGYSAFQTRSGIEEENQGAGSTPSDEEQVQIGGSIVAYDSVELENLTNVYEQLTVRAQIRIKEAAQAAGGRLYLHTVFDPFFSENPFKLEQRSYPVDMEHPMNYKTILNIKLPQGYEVEEIPEGVRFALPNQAGSFSMSYSDQAQVQKLQIISHLTIQKLHYNPNEYGMIKQLFDLLIQKQREQVVLVKSEVAKNE